MLISLAGGRTEDSGQGEQGRVCMHKPPHAFCTDYVVFYASTFSRRNKYFPISIHRQAMSDQIRASDIFECLCTLDSPGVGCTFLYQTQNPMDTLHILCMDVPTYVFGTCRLFVLRARVCVGREANRLSYFGAEYFIISK